MCMDFDDQGWCGHQPDESPHGEQMTESALLKRAIMRIEDLTRRVEALENQHKRLGPSYEPSGKIKEPT